MDVVGGQYGTQLMLGSDHNNCFDKDHLNRENMPSIVVSGKTMREAAELCVKRSELKLEKVPTSKMFPSKLAYETFVGRCKQLGLWPEEKRGKFLNVFR